MKALIFQGLGKRVLEERPMPVVQTPTRCARRQSGPSLVDTATLPMLLKIVQAEKINPKLLITHRFTFDRIMDAYETFGHAAATKALKVVISA